MITIKKIEIKGFFGKGDFVWNLDPIVNILGGKNGSGKSTIFKFCYILLTDERIDDTIDRFMSHLFEKFSITFSNKWSLIWTCLKGNEGISIDFEPQPIKVFRENAVQIFDGNKNVRKFKELKQLVDVYLLNSFEQHISQARRYELLPKSIQLDDPTMLDLMIKAQIDLRNLDFSKTMEYYMDSSGESDSKRATYIGIYKKLYSSLSQFLHDYDQPFNSSFEFSRKGQPIRYEYLSMGEKQILLLLLMVANTKQVPCIFFMDEPDLSMHIDWKEKLVKELHELNPYMQIILSTHAPSVITGWHDKVKEVNQLIK